MVLSQCRSLILHLPYRIPRCRTNLLTQLQTRRNHPGPYFYRIPVNDKNWKAVKTAINTSMPIRGKTTLKKLRAFLNQRNINWSKAMTYPELWLKLAEWHRNNHLSDLTPPPGPPPEKKPDNPSPTIPLTATQQQFADYFLGKPSPKEENASREAEADRLSRVRDDASISHRKNVEHLRMLLRYMGTKVTSKGNRKELNEKLIKWEREIAEEPKTPKAAKKEEVNCSETGESSAVEVTPGKPKEPNATEKEEATPHDAGESSVVEATPGKPPTPIAKPKAPEHPDAASAPTNASRNRLAARDKYGDPFRTIEPSEISPYLGRLDSREEPDVVASYTLDPGNVHIPGTIPTLKDPLPSSMTLRVPDRPVLDHIPTHVSALRACLSFRSPETHKPHVDVSTTASTLVQLLLFPLRTTFLVTHVEGGLVHLALFNAAHADGSKAKAAPKKGRMGTIESLWPQVTDSERTDAPLTTARGYRHLHYKFGTLSLLVMARISARIPDATQPPSPKGTTLSVTDTTPLEQRATIDGMQVTYNAGKSSLLHRTADADISRTLQSKETGLFRERSTTTARNWFSRMRWSCTLNAEKDDTVRPVLLDTSETFLGWEQRVQEALQHLHGVLQSLADAARASKSGMCFVVNSRSNDKGSLITAVRQEIYEVPANDEAFEHCWALARTKAEFGKKSTGSDASAPQQSSPSQTSANPSTSSPSNQVSSTDRHPADSITP